MTFDAVVVTALFAIIAGFVTFLTTRVASLEKKLEALDDENNDLWWWARGIADQYYIYRIPGSPSLPPPPKTIRGYFTSVEKKEEEKA